MKPHEKLGVAIADAGYTWTPEMRSAWEELDRQQDRIAGLEKQILTVDLEELKKLLSEPDVDGFMYVVFRGKDSASIREYGKIYPQNIAPQTKPLSDEEIAKENLRKLNIALESQKLSDEEIIKIRVLTKPKSTVNWADTLVFARAIEERHGIK